MIDTQISWWPWFWITGYIWNTQYLFTSTNIAMNNEYVSLNLIWCNSLYYLIGHAYYRFMHFSFMIEGNSLTKTGTLHLMDCLPTYHYKIGVLHFIKLHYQNMLHWPASPSGKLSQQPNQNSCSSSNYQQI